MTASATADGAGGPKEQKVTSNGELDWLLDDLVTRDFDSGNARQIIVEMEAAFLFVTAAGEGSCLAVLTSAQADVGLVAYEMAVLVKRVGQDLSVNPRPTPTGDGTM